MVTRSIGCADSLDYLHCFLGLIVELTVYSDHLLDRVFPQDNWYRAGCAGDCAYFGHTRGTVPEAVSPSRKIFYRPAAGGPRSDYAAVHGQV